MQQKERFTTYLGHDCLRIRTSCAAKQVGLSTKYGRMSRKDGQDALANKTRTSTSLLVEEIRPASHVVTRVRSFEPHKVHQEAMLDRKGKHGDHCGLTAAGRKRA